jgi:ligand-binding sensor domain-containing protein
MGIHNKQLSVHSLCRYKENLWVGTEDGYVFTFDPVTGSAVIPPKTSDSMGGASNVTKVLLEIKTRDLLIGRQKQILALSGLSNAQTGSLKDIRPAYENNVLVSTSNGVWLMDFITFKVGETIWNDRATTAHYSDNFFYIGTLDGLYIVTKQKEIYFAGK